MSYYYNAAGQRFELPERPLEPPDAAANAQRPKKRPPMIKRLSGADNTEQPKQTPHTP